ncbi:MAG: transcriptional regulator [archaeon]|nr:transcriptional regulator [archaeon]
MFEVYLTPNGPLILENEQKIRIMHSIFRGNRTFSAIQRDTGYSKSSVYTFLKKLVADGYLRAEFEDLEGIDTQYAQDSHLVLTSVEIDEDHRKINQPFFMDERYQDNLERWLWGYFVYSGHCSGISVAPLLGEVLYEIGKVAGELADSAEDPALLGPVIDILSKCRYAQVVPISPSRLTHNITMLFNATRRSTETMLRAVISMMCGYLSSRTGKEYHVSDWSQSPENYGCVNISLEETDSVHERGYRRIEFSEGPECDFSIFWTGESYVPVVGETYNSIVQMLHVKPCSSQQISDELGIPQSTVSGYLKDLESRKVIISKRFQKRVEYRLFAIKTFDWKNFDPTHYDDAHDIAVKCVRDPEHAVRYWFQFYFHLQRLIGFDYELQAHYFGRRVGIKLLEDFPEDTPDRIFDRLVHESHKVLSADFAVISISPLTIARVADYDMDEFTASIYATVYDALFTSLFSTYVKVPFRVKSSSVYGEGNRGYRATYLPDPTL